MTRRRKKRAIASGEVNPVEDALERGGVLADRSQQVGNSIDPGPTHYVDRPFTCRDCGAKEVWTAEQQKWYYEVAKGSIHAKAVRCRACRDKIKAEKDLQRQQMQRAESDQAENEKELHTPGKA